MTSSQYDPHADGNDYGYSYAYDCNVSPAASILLQGGHMTQPRSRQPVAVIPEEENIYEEIGEDVRVPPTVPMQTAWQKHSPCEERRQNASNAGSENVIAHVLQNDRNHTVEVQQKQQQEQAHKHQQQQQLHSGEVNRGAVSAAQHARQGSLVDEVMYEVHRRHHQVLGELNLDMEAMLMPGNPSEYPDEYIGPADDLLSPDSGFQSGSGCVGHASGSAATPVGMSNHVIPIRAAFQATLSGMEPHRTARYVSTPSRASFDAAMMMGTRPPQLHKCESLDFRPFLPHRKSCGDVREKLREEGCDKKAGNNNNNNSSSNGSNKKGWRFRGWGSVRDKRASLDSTGGLDVGEGLSDGISASNGMLAAVAGTGRRRGSAGAAERTGGGGGGGGHQRRMPEGRRRASAGLWESSSAQSQQPQQQPLLYEEVDSVSQSSPVPTDTVPPPPPLPPGPQYPFQSLDGCRQLNQEESWWSADSEPASSASSTDDEAEVETESEKSNESSSRGTDTFKAKFLRATALKEKWKEARGKTKEPQQEEGRLSRWFSLRKSQHYDDKTVDRSRTTKMPQLPEEEEGTALLNLMFHRRHQPPSLPPLPAGLTTEQVKRRHIIATVVHSENSYVATLQRLVNDYKKPLEESNPPILSASKMSTLFYRVPEILQCHTLFRIALAECVRNWDREEKIGDVFVASFSKAIVLEIYSDFINNFSVAMDLAKHEAKRKSALADFLKVKQITAHDRLSFFGLMVKPVQRFPQFILLLQDLLKHTPQGHHDRMSLQLALTQLESLAEMLNERKREAEQYQAFKDMLRSISGKFALKSFSDGNRYLLRDDNMMLLEFNQSGLITKSKSRRLLLLNDLLLCVSVVPRASDDFGNSERLTLKWAHPVTDIEIQDTSASPTLSRVLTAGLNKGGSLTKSERPPETHAGVDNLCQEMNDLMHDYEVVSRISGLISSLKGDYYGLNRDLTRSVLNSIQQSIQQKDEEIAWVDSCCLQFTVRNKSGKEEQFTFQTENPSIKKDWIVELRLAQLALDVDNSPSWDVPEQERRPMTKMPLFVKSAPVYKSQHQTEVRCGCFYTVTVFKPTRRVRHQSYLWLCATDGVSSHVIVYAVAQVGMTESTTIHMVETRITAMEFVPGPVQDDKLKGDLVWIGTDSRRLLVYCAMEPEKQEEIASCSLPAAVTKITCHCDQVFVALANGSVAIYRRHLDDGWDMQDPQMVLLGMEPVASLLPINQCMYAACGKKVWVLDAASGEVQRHFSIQHDHVGDVHLMAHSGIGLWISVKNSSTICLYHTETFKHLQDINIASNVSRILANRELNHAGRTIHVTALMAGKGLLWVGTNVGIALTIPLPRLEGVPIVSGRANISYHAHFGPITFLLPLTVRRREAPKPKKRNSSNAIQEEVEERAVLQKQLSDTHLLETPSKPTLKAQLSSPVILRRRPKENGTYRACKTLPRGLGMLSVHGSQEYDVYGLYGDLLNVKDYEEDHPLNDAPYESLRRSDPELALPNKVNTLDRRLKMKASRPRSLDLSNWSVESRSSTYTSSGSEESVPVTPNVVNSAPTTIKKGTVNKIHADMPRTIVTLMAGRGYINWRKASLESKPEKGKSNSTTPVKVNANDAHVILWEMKL